MSKYSVVVDQYYVGVSKYSVCVDQYYVGVDQYYVGESVVPSKCGSVLSRCESMLLRPSDGVGQNLAKVNFISFFINSQLPCKNIVSFSSSLFYPLPPPLLNSPLTSYPPPPPILVPRSNDIPILAPPALLPQQLNFPFHHFIGPLEPGCH